MAKLTAELDTINSGVGPVRPSGGGGGAGAIFGAAAKLGSQLINVKDKLDDKAWQDEQRARARVEWGRADERYDRDNEERSVDNQVASYIFDQTASAAQANINPSTAKSIDDILRLNSAAQAGRVPQTMVDLHLESLVSKIETEHPDQMAHVANVLQSKGLDHYVFRDVKNQLALQDQEDQNQRAALQTYYQAGIQRGAPDPNNYDATVKFGQEALGYEAKLKALKDQAEVTAKNKQMTREETEFQQKQDDRSAIGTFREMTGQRLLPLMNNINLLVSAAGSDAERQHKLTEFLPQVVNGFETWRQNLHAQAPYMTQDGHKALDEMVDGYKNSVAEIFTGVLSEDKLNMQYYNSLKAGLGIQDAQALPLYTGMVNLFGRETVNQLFSPTGDMSTALNPDLKKQIVKEISGYNPADKAGSAVHLNNLVQMLEGNLKLTDMSPQEAKKQITHLNGAFTAGRNAIIGDRAQPVDKRNYVNSLSNLTNAANELQPGTSDPKSRSAALAIIASPDTRTSLAKLATDPQYKEEVTAVTAATRNVSVKLLEIEKANPVSQPNFGNNFQKIVFDKADGRYKIVLDEDAMNKNFDKSPYATALSPKQSPGSKEAYRHAPVDSKLQTQRNNMNMALDHLSQTESPELPKGLTPLQTREFYANGTIPKDKEGKPQISGADQFQKQVDNVTKALRELPEQIIRDAAPGIKDADVKARRTQYAPKVAEAASKNDVPSNVLSSVLELESGWDANAKNPGSTATGLGQFIDDTAKKYGLIDDQGDHRTDPHRSIDATAHYLADLKASGKYKNWTEVAHAYGVLAKSNFKKKDGSFDEEAYNAKVERFRRLAGLDG